MVFNAGSSSLKHSVYDADRHRLGSGIAEGIAEPGAHESAAIAVIDSLGEHRFLATGHRVVHGGTLTEHVVVDDGVISKLEQASALAPLHNPPALAVMRGVRNEMGSEVPSIAAFDTAFFSAIPDRVKEYPIPRELAHRHGIRRYGFHGLAHQSMLLHAANSLGRPPDQVSAITLQLGNGCSAALIEEGTAIDMSMGMTPLEGMMMGTRSGSIDPSIVATLAEGEELSASEAVAILNSASGLAGVSGVSSDLREIEDAANAGDERAVLAIEMFAYGIRKQIGAFLAAAGPVEAVVFGGGIGENSERVRSTVIAGLERLGVGSEVPVLVASVDEMAVIARIVADLIGVA